MYILLCLLSSFTVYSANISDSTLYKNILVNEKISPKIQEALNGFLKNTRFIPDKKALYNDREGFVILREYTVNEVDYLIGKIHNILIDTLYHCDATAPRADSFEEALDGRHTPDSQHYAALMHSALAIRGIETSFFKTPSHYGIYYKDEKTGKELYWCILTHLEKSGAACSREDYVEIYNRNKNEDINGDDDLTVADITMLTAGEFMNADFSASIDDSDTYTQKILAPRGDAVARGDDETGIEEEVPEVQESFAEPVKPVLGVAALKDYKGSVDLFDNRGLLFANEELSDLVKLSTLSNSDDFKGCLAQNDVKRNKVILKFKIDQDGSVKNTSVDNIQDNAFQSCVAALWDGKVRVDPAKLKEPVKVLQIIKL
ncbi:MAG: hypothetical protein JXA66_04635 [Oligoflexia bacterium]|nr:hypothetical protein [Oligoflexia bacterium]